MQAKTLSDPICRMLVQYIQNSWPTPNNLDRGIKKFYSARQFLTTVNGLIFFNNRVYIPTNYRKSVLDEVHTGHLGEVKCLKRAKEIWWPGMTSEIKSKVKNCNMCREYRRIPREPLIPSIFPERPWWVLAADFFQWNDSCSGLLQ